MYPSIRPDRDAPCTWSAPCAWAPPARPLTTWSTPAGWLAGCLLLPCFWLRLCVCSLLLVATGYCRRCWLTTAASRNAPGRRRSLPTAVPLYFLNSLDGELSQETTGSERGAGNCQENLRGAASSSPPRARAAGGRFWLSPTAAPLRPQSEGVCLWLAK